MDHQAAEKHTTYAAMMRLGFPVPPTAMLPPKEYEDTGDVLATVRRYNKLFAWARPRATSASRCS